MATRDLCFKCYRQQERASDRQFAGVDRHNPAIRREHKKLFRAFTAVMGGLSDLGISKDDVFIIRQTVEPYLAPIAKFLTVTPEQDESEVNSEHKSPTQFTVHTDLSAAREEKAPTRLLLQTMSNVDEKGEEKGDPG